jgi:hypothetical protein
MSRCAQIIAPEDNPFDGTPNCGGFAAVHAGRIDDVGLQRAQYA